MSLSEQVNVAKLTLMAQTIVDLRHFIMPHAGKGEQFTA
jgi:hypothetical protein